MTKTLRKLTALVLALAMCLGLVSFASADDAAANIAITGTIGSINPLLIDATENEKMAMSLVWAPLVELNADLEFVPMLAESITTEDNLTFTIKLADNAVWSDGKPVTAQDVLFTLLLVTSPEAGKAYLQQYLIVGTDDDGFMPEGATAIEGVQIVDEKTITVTCKWQITLNTFNNNFGRYLFVLPEHVLKDVPRAELLAYDWFNNPTVVSGPYFVTAVDLNNYVYYAANENYFLGAPKIKYLNINRVDPARVLIGLQSGEIDLVQQTTGAIPMEDYDAVRALPNVKAVQGAAITVQQVFINCNNVPDKRIRQALLYGMDRQTVLEGVADGNGEIIDGYIVSANPYFDASLPVTAYDPEKAAALVAEAVADGASAELTWYAWSDDTAFLAGIEYIVAGYEEIGLHVDIKPVDLDTLMAKATNQEVDMMSVQYTYPPVDPYTDGVWLLDAAGWTAYGNEAVINALYDTQSNQDEAAVKADFSLVTAALQEDVPMIAAYVMNTLGAVSSRLNGANPDVFGTFINVHEWTIQ